MSKKIFLAAPFKQHIEEGSPSMPIDKRNEIGRIIELLEKKGHIVDNAHRRESWGECWMSPDVCTPLDFKAIAAADIIIAMPGFPASGGVHIELGWASAQNKEIYLLLEMDKYYSNLIVGMESLDCKVKVIRYENFEHLIQQLNETIN